MTDERVDPDPRAMTKWDSAGVKWDSARTWDTPVVGLTLPEQCTLSPLGPLIGGKDYA